MFSLFSKPSPLCIRFFFFTISFSFKLWDFAHFYSLFIFCTPVFLLCLENLFSFPCLILFHMFSIRSTSFIWVFFYFSYSHSLHPPFSSYFLFVLNAIVLMHFSFNSYFLFTFAFVVYFFTMFCRCFWWRMFFFSHFTIQIFFSCNVRTLCTHVVDKKKLFSSYILCSCGFPSLINVHTQLNLTLFLLHRTFTCQMVDSNIWAFVWFLSLSLSQVDKNATFNNYPRIQKYRI